MPSYNEMRAKINLRTIPQTELLTYDFQDITRTSAELVLNWAGCKPYFSTRSVTTSCAATVIGPVTGASISSPVLL